MIARLPGILAGLLLLCCHGQAAAAPPPPLSAYGNLPGVEDMAIAPAGQRLAAIARINGSRVLLLLDGQHNVLRQLTLGDVKVRSLQWVGDDRVMVVTSATEVLGPGFTAYKYEFYGALLVPLGNEPPKMVFQNRPSLARAIFGEYGTRVIGGKWHGFFGGIELNDNGRTGYSFNHGRPALFGVELGDNQPRKIDGSPGAKHQSDWLIDEAGRVAVRLNLDDDNGQWDIRTDRGILLARGTNPRGDISLVALGKDGTTAIYSLRKEKAEEAHWFEVALAGGASTEILPDVDMERVYIDRTNGRLLGYLEGGAQERPVLFDPARQAVFRKVYRAFANLRMELRDWTPDFSKVLVRTAGNGDSGSWFLVDVARLKADPVGNERPGIAAEQVGAISTVTYKAADGLDLDGILTLPPGVAAKNLPLVMLPHGGPQSEDDATFDWWAQAFASRGYAVFQPNFRGSTNRDGAFRRAGYGQWGRKMQTDISDGLAELARQGIVDPKRACIVGASYGGYAALAGVTLQQGLYRCAVAVAPVSDLSDFYSTKFEESNNSRMRKISLQESLGSPSTFAAVSPRRNAARADAPILLIHGKDDTVVAFSQSSAMANALKDAGRPYEFVTLKEEDHWLSRSATRQQMLEAAVGFVQRHNPADPAK